MAIYSPPTYTGVLLPTSVPQFNFPDDKNEPSYFDLGLTSSTVQPLTPVAGTTSWYDAWCLDENASIGFNVGTTVTLYSSYEQSILLTSPAVTLSPALAANLDKLDNINWLLNYYTGQAPYGRADVQVAIWNLLGQAAPTSPNSPANVYGYSQANANDLVVKAMTLGEGYVPGVGDSISILLSTTQGSTATQPLIIETKAAALGDYVWLDSNGNGVQDATEPGVQGVTVKLVRDLDQSGTITPNEVLATTATNASGLYSFTGLTPGLDYQVQFVLPGGLAFTPRDQGADDAKDSDANLATGVTPVVVLAPGEFNRTIDAGLVLPPPPSAALGNFVWEDKNANGLQDANDVGINGVAVSLLQDTDNNGLPDTVVAVTVTGDDPSTAAIEKGFYKFSGLTPGVAYQVQFTNPDSVGPDAYTFSPANQGANDSVDSDADVTTGKSQVVTLASGEYNDTVDAGLFRKGSIHAFGFLDINGDGVQNNGDSAFPDAPGKTFVLTGPNNFTQTVTTVSGQANWVSLTPGTYTITENPIPNGYALTSTPNTRTFVVNSGEELVYTPGAANLPAGDTRVEVNLTDMLKWGNTQLASLGNFVWEDKNANGLQDANDVGINGVVVTLLKDTDNNGIPDTPVASTTTGDDPSTAAVEKGFYKFSGLTPGVAYQVQFNNPDSVGPDAYTFSPANQGANDSVDSDADVTTGKSQVVTLASGEYNDTVDAGLFRKGSIHAFGFLDINGDGVQNGGDSAFPDAPGKTFVLTGPNNLTQTVTTVSGKANWVSLTPGTYTITENPIPNGYALTSTPNTRTFVVNSGEELVYTPGAANLPAGDTRVEVNLTDMLKWGNTQLASLGDRLWNDVNGDGKQDANHSTEPGISGQLVTLIGGGADGIINGVGDTTATTVTGADGLYAFTGLTPGVQYQVQFAKPAGTNFTTQDVGSNAFDTVDSDVNVNTGTTQIVTLSSGENNITLDAGVVTPPPPAPGIQIVKDANKVIVAPNTPVTYTYSVTNTGGVPLSNISVTDDNATPDFAGDDFAPTAVLQTAGTFAGRNIGDLNGDNKLDLTEVWKYSATVVPPVVMTVTTTTGATPVDSGTLSYTTLANGDVRVFYRQSDLFNDNTYGTGSDAGWTSQGKTHKFSDLTGSDKAGFLVKYADGTTLVQFYMDYITASTTQDTLDSYTTYSGYRSLGYTGGDGSLVAGNGAVLKDFDSTLELNLNQAGTANNGVAYKSMTVNSPVGDANWDVVDGYYFTISASAFASKAFGGVTIFDQHNSPAKIGASNSYVPDIEAHASVNTATVVGFSGNVPVTDDDDASVAVVTGPLGSLGDRVWVDLNANGVQEASETGITGVKLTLTGDFNKDGVVDYTASTVTGTNGIYTFDGLPAGVYTVTVDGSTVPGNYVQTYDLDGLATPGKAVAELTSGQNRVDVDFGYVPSAPGFSLVKTADKATATFGQPITYTYKVSNTGALPLTGVALKDDNATPNNAADDFSPTYVSGDAGVIGQLDPGETWTYTATVTPPVELQAVGVNGYTGPAGTLTSQVLANGDIRVTYRQSTSINDNTYGTGKSTGWSTHTFNDLVGSDKAGFELKDKNGTTVMKFYMDYITASSTQEVVGGVNEYTTYSGYRSLGVTGGDGSISIGSATNLYDFDSTLEQNLNRTGYTTVTTNSPVGDPNWDAVDGYSFTVKAAAFGTAGFGSAMIFDQHNSPSKLGINSFVPTLQGGEVTNTAIVTAKLSGNTVVAVDDATVIVGPAGSGDGGGGTTKFFVADVGADDVFKYSSTGASTGNFSLAAGNIDARDIAANADGSKLWVLDKNKTVNVYAADGTVLSKWTAGGLSPEPEGITLDGNDIWVATRDRKIYWYDNAASNANGANDAPEKTFAPAMTGNLKGIVSDGAKLWAVTEAATDIVYRFTIGRDGAGNATGLTLDGSWKLATANSKPTGITIDPTGASQAIWLVDEATDTVYQYDGARSLTSGTGVISTSFVLSSTNLSPQGIADPQMGVSTDWLANLLSDTGDAAADQPGARSFTDAGYTDVDLVGVVTQGHEHLTALP